MELGRAQVMAFRVARHDLGDPADDLLEAAESWTVQDTPPGSAALALHARVPDAGPDELERLLLEERSLVVLYNPRHAPIVVPAAAADVFTAAFRPRDEGEWQAVIGSGLRDARTPPLKAIDQVSAAVHDALDGGPLSRDDLHEELRHRVDGDLLPWCDGCKSHHVRRQLITCAALRGELCFAGRAGRQPRFARPDQWLAATVRATVEPDTAARQLVRRYLRRYAPSTPALFAQWAGIGPAQARRTWAMAEDGLVESDGAWLLLADLPLLTDPPPATGVRMLPPLDPFLQARDRELLVPDPERRKAVWRALGNPGMVLADGDLIAAWRPSKKKSRLEVTVEPFGPLTGDTREAIAAAVERMAPHRGCTTAHVRFADGG